MYVIMAREGEPERVREILSVYLYDDAQNWLASYRGQIDIDDLFVLNTRTLQTYILSDEGELIPAN